MKVIGPETKSFPETLWTVPVDQVGGHRLPLSSFHTPLVTLEERGLQHNLYTMAAWTRARGIDISPHGKTTMSPALWHRQITAGAWGITLATPWQARIAQHHGIEQIMLANTLADEANIRWASGLPQAGVRLVSWLDHLDTLRLIEDVLGGTPGARIDVLVELGAAGGRTGARGTDHALALGRAAAASGAVNLVGVAGYEGAVPAGSDGDKSRAVRSFLADLAQLHEQLSGESLYDAEVPILTAGGSAYMDEVADILGAAAQPGRVVIRSGAYLVHDDGLYREVSPWGQVRGGENQLRPAMHGWARVISTPEPGLVICDAGKRDFSFDEGLPQAQLVVGWTAEESQRLLANSKVEGLNDQHLFLRLGEQGVSELKIGQVLRFGLSHPCTVLDKWRVIPVIDDASVSAPTVVGALPLFF